MAIETKTKKDDKSRLKEACDEYFTMAGDDNRVYNEARGLAYNLRLDNFLIHCGNNCELAREYLKSTQ